MIHKEGLLFNNCS